MKIRAAILLVYLLGLFIQPLAFPRHHSAEVVPACCAQKEAGKHRGCTKDKGCCADGPCNPFFTQCPACAANAVPPNITFDISLSAQYYTERQFSIFHQCAISNYMADIFRPPQAIV